MISGFSFKIISEDKKTRARAGKITTPHGVIETPGFVAVGTKASVKSLTPSDLKDTGTQLIFGNTYHLYLSPGEKLIRNFGGLGKFMNWNGPTITDSGGFQVFSLGKNKRAARLLNDEKEEETLVKISDNGVYFKSIIDGSTHEFTPEKSIEIQKDLGADIMIAFDECTTYPSSLKYAKEAMERTHVWAKRSLTAANKNRRKPYQALYGVVQGGIYQELREKSAKFIAGLPFDGVAIGGVSVGESKKEMRDVLKWTVPFLSKNKPRHLLGVGEIDDIFVLVENGMDTFDCVIPTRLARTGFVFVAPPEGKLSNRFRIDLQKSHWKTSAMPLDRTCDCYVCQNFTRGYLHHLFRNRELLAYRLASYHNIYFINSLTAKIREAIFNSSFTKLKKHWLTS